MQSRVILSGLHMIFHATPANVAFDNLEGGLSVVLIAARYWL